jgi:hypothetical protein
VGGVVGDVVGPKAAGPKAAIVVTISCICILQGTRTHLRIYLAV